MGWEEQTTLEVVAKDGREGYDFLKESMDKLFSNYSIGATEMKVSKGIEDVVNISPPKGREIKKISPLTNPPKGILRYSSPESVRLDIGETGYNIHYTPMDC